MAVTEMAKKPDRLIRRTIFTPVWMASVTKPVRKSGCGRAGKSLSARVAAMAMTKKIKIIIAIVQSIRETARG